MAAAFVLWGLWVIIPVVINAQKRSTCQRHKMQMPTPPQQPTDPQVWYELQGRQVLEDLIADLHSRGHSSLNIKDNGDICIKQADTEVTAQTLKNFPQRNYWQALAKVFEKEGLAAAVTETGLAVTW